jgi:hypothetical protein
MYASTRLPPLAMATGTATSVRLCLGAGHENLGGPSSSAAPARLRAGLLRCLCLCLRRLLVVELTRLVLLARLAGSPAPAGGLDSGPGAANGEMALLRSWPAMAWLGLALP